jgi:GTP-binding protein HflX
MKHSTDGETVIKEIFGSTAGLKASQIQALRRLYRRRVDPKRFITPELAGRLLEISREIHRQVGVLLTRRGEILWVLVGDAFSIMIPDLSGFRMGTGNLKGLRFIHTHLKNAPIDREDITDLRMLRLDLVGVLKEDRQGHPGELEIAYLDPEGEESGCTVERFPFSQWLDRDYTLWMADRIDALQRALTPARRLSKKTRALVVVVPLGGHWDVEALLQEIIELSEACDVEVVGHVIQRVRRVHPAYLIGEGKLKER